MIKLKLEVRRFSPGDDVPDDGILLIRHGPRTSPDIPPLSAMLTQSGIEACQSLGALLHSTPPIRLFSSPVKRCLDTGTYIVEGANWSLPVLPSEMLGDPGPFVIGKTNEAVNKLVAYAQEQNDWSFLHEHIAGGTVPECATVMSAQQISSKSSIHPLLDMYCASHTIPSLLQ